ncbi:MAG: 3-deoxy-D-manno-octulosonic acid transferase [Rhodospirillaceae bacterium]
MLQTLYRGLTRHAGPLIGYYLHRRRLAGKEDANRQGERLGLPARPRPSGPLVWFHAASVGESLSVMILINRMIAADPALHVLVTTGTVTSARLMAERLPQRAFHQFVPVDHQDYVTRFLDHWHPDLALWTESEIWPNMLWEIKRRQMPAALLNARMSERSARRWQRFPGFIGPLLATFKLCLAQTAADADRLCHLGAFNVRSLGNLKFSADPPPAEPVRLAALATAIGTRPVWLFASSHPGEDEIVAANHAELATTLPGLLTIIAPRHPRRGGDILAMLSGRGIKAACRSTGELPKADDAIYIADTIGEMGILFRLAPVACVGGSLVPHGGQNPIEPAQLGCAVLFGPHMTNFAEVSAELTSAGAAIAVADGAELAKVVARLLLDGAERAQMAEACVRVTDTHRQVADRVLLALRPLLMDAGVAPPEPSSFHQ